MPSAVRLHVYDLSQGLASSLSGALLQKEFKAVYHTGVVVYDTEFFFGQGIDTGYPGATAYGTPIRREDKGQTEKTLAEIQAWVDKQNQTAFSGTTYDPMNHNCNHFSAAFLEFLNGSQMEAEILEQPAEFLATPLGKLVGQMMGFSATPASFQKEEINEEYKSLYIEDPRVYVAEDEVIIAAITGLGCSVGLTNQLNRVLNAAQDKQDFQAESALMEELNNVAISENLFEVLALCCMTSTFERIPEGLKPLAIIQKQPAETENSEAFLRYMNNWLCEPLGMQEARVKAVEYSAYIRRQMEGTAALGACRCYYAFARTQTLACVKQTSPILFLLQLYPTYLEKRQKSEKPWTICLNLVCGCIGRFLLTIKPRDASTYNQLRLRVQKELDFEALKGVNAPCVKDLVKLVGKKEQKKAEEDEMF